MSDTPPSLPPTSSSGSITGSASSTSKPMGEGNTDSINKAESKERQSEVSEAPKNIVENHHNLRSSSQVVTLPHPDEGEIKIRLLTEKSHESSRRDKWDKADIFAKLLSSVVLAGVGLLINSSIQRAQIASSESNAQAQLNAAKLKASDDKKLQEGSLTAQLVQHLSSDNATQREIAIIALRESVPSSIYDATIGVLARSDPSKEVRLRAIENLSTSPTVAAAKTLTSIAKDVNRPAEERRVAETSSQKAALSQVSVGNDQVLTDVDEVVFAAASRGEFAIETNNLRHGVFTYSVLDGLQGRADLNGDGVVEARELGKHIIDNAMKFTAGGQNPFYSSTATGVVPLNKPRSPRSKVKALAVGLSSYADRSIQPLAYPMNDARSIAEFYKRALAAETYVITGSEATKENILSTLQRLANSVGPEDVLVFYFGGYGLIVEGRGMLIPYSARADSPADYIPMDDLKSILKHVNHKIFYIDSCFSTDTGR